MMTADRYLIRPMTIPPAFMVIDTAPRECRDERGKPFICRHYVVAAGCTHDEAVDYIRQAEKAAAEREDRS